MVLFWEPKFFYLLWRILLESLSLSHTSISFFICEYRFLSLNHKPQLACIVSQLYVPYIT